MHEVAGHALVLPRNHGPPALVIRRAHDRGAEPLDGPSLASARSWASELGIHLLAGSIAERAEGEERLFNTSVLIDPDGNYYGQISGEGAFEVLDHHIEKMVKEHRAKKTIKEAPINFALVKEEKQTPLYFPGKVLADTAGNRLFIAATSTNSATDATSGASSNAASKRSG